MRNMKLLVLSDLHVTTGAPIYGRDPVTWLTRAVDHIVRCHAGADRCLIVGDLAHHGRVAEYRALKAALERLPMPYGLTLGNHDDRGHFLSVFGSDFADETGFVQSVIDIGTYRCLLVDTHRPGSGAGSLDNGRLERLEAMIAGADRPCLLFMHHPPIDTCLPAFETIGLIDRPAFAAMLAAHRDTVAGIFFGHCHMPINGTIEGIPAFGVRSPVYQSLPDFDRPRFLAGPDLLPAYSLVIETGSGLAIHAIEFGYSGPITASD